VHYQFGVELFNRAQFDKAELEFGHAIEQDPNVPSYYMRRGDAARYLEKHQEACADYQQALRINPNDAETHVGAHPSLRKLPKLTVNFQTSRRQNSSSITCLHHRLQEINSPSDLQKQSRLLMRDRHNSTAHKNCKPA
jgi:tetratricopeptide (TPR) repeat protein